MTFKVCNHGSKYPHLIHKMGFFDSKFGTIALYLVTKSSLCTYLYLTEGKAGGYKNGDFGGDFHLCDNGKEGRGNF